MFAYYILPTIYVILLFIFSSLKPDRFAITVNEFQSVMMKSLLLAFLAVTITNSGLTRFYGLWFNVTLLFSMGRVIARVRQQK
ncbi:hypothetical protein FE410_00420 [Leuconostoc carnosum]|uniref:hypothetical protein n=1 Tax=Leuconostoc carnosum TaxID=1252 RepID=UPI0012387641|nr:hypothetical protein [Leuconostoc carnosum]KAA8371436.1 hypothetical protein FE414_00420 [Leuconostoc carnosum]KAA8383157.1 hypothetical protein FE410_00420 [Leuconostoc carnosum]